MGPSFGRLLPMPLLIPNAWRIMTVVTMIWPVIGMIADKRRNGPHGADRHSQDVQDRYREEKRHSGAEAEREAPVGQHVDGCRLFREHDRIAEIVSGNECSDFEGFRCARRCHQREPSRMILAQRAVQIKEGRTARMQAHRSQSFMHKRRQGR